MATLELKAYETVKSKLGLEKAEVVIEYIHSEYSREKC